MSENSIGKKRLHNNHIFMLKLPKLAVEEMAAYALRNHYASLSELMRAWIRKELKEENHVCNASTYSSPAIPKVEATALRAVSS
jgi:hypothetical protein